MTLLAAESFCNSSQVSDSRPFFLNRLFSGSRGLGNRFDDKFFSNPYLALVPRWKDPALQEKHHWLKVIIARL